MCGRLTLNSDSFIVGAILLMAFMYATPNILLESVTLVDHQLGHVQFWRNCSLCLIKS